MVAAHTGQDATLSWRVHSVMTLGEDATGPAVSYRVFPWNVAADATGRFCVLDMGDHRVVVFDRRRVP